jgi:general secretion pathway protein D
MNIPYLGSLFSIKSDSLDRTELIVLITPHVIRDQLGADATTRELREKLPLLRTLSSDGAR